MIGQGSPIMNLDERRLGPVPCANSEQARRGDLEPALCVVAFVSRRDPARGGFRPREASHIAPTELRDPRVARSPAARVRATMCG